MNFIGNLPEEMLITIAAFLEPEDVSSLSQTCHAFYDMRNSLFNSYHKTINRLNIQQKKVAEEINKKYAPFKILQTEYDTLESLIVAPLVEPRKKLSEIIHKGEEIYSQKPVALEKYPLLLRIVASAAGIFPIARRIQTEHQQLLQLRQQAMHDHMQLLADASQQVLEAEKECEIERKTKLEPLLPALGQAKKTYEECLSLLTMENETPEIKQLKNRIFKKIIREIFNAIIGKEKPVVKVIETETIDKRKLALMVGPNCLTVFVSPKGLRTIILKSPKGVMRFIQEFITKKLVVLSTNCPSGSASVLFMVRKGKLDFQALQEFIEILKPTIEELYPE